MGPATWEWMSKRYGEGIDVEASAGAVDAFWWRGKRYRVRRVLARWRETGGWWLADGHDERRARAGMAGHALEYLRVDTLPRGVFEIALDLRNGAWTLARVLD